MADPRNTEKVDGAVHFETAPRATHPVGNTLEVFVEELRGLREMLPVLSATAREAEEVARRRKQSVLEGSARPPSLEEDRMKSLEERHRPAAALRTDLLQPRVAATGWSHAERELGAAVLLMMSAHFDRFVGDMVQAAFKIQPDLTKALRRELSFTDLVDLPDIEAVKALVIEKEIEQILHNKRSEQVKWFVSRCKMPAIDSTLEAELSDISELRNIIAHHGGLVTSRVGFGWRNRKTRLLFRYEAGQQVMITNADVAEVHDVFFVAAVLIAQGVWRGLREDQGLSADADLHELTYSRLALDEFRLTQRTLQLSFVHAPTMSRSARLVHTVNLAQTYKWLGEPKACEDVLGQESWDEEEPAYRFAVSALREEWDEAGSLMEQCAREDQVERVEFENWPVLRDFRDTKQYRRAFKRIYGS